MSKKVKNILADAEKAKLDAEKSLIKTVKPKAIERKRPVTPSHDERFEVHQMLFEKDLGILWLLPISFGVIPWLIWMSKGMTTNNFIITIAGLVSIPILRYLYIKIEARLTYPSFRYWRRKLPFEFVGWHDLVDHPEFSYGYWRLEAELTIVPKEGSPKTEEISALLYLFTKKANQEFYKADFIIPNFGGDPRKKWKVEANQAKGSINAGVTKVLYSFLKSKLTAVAEEYQNIITVNIKAEPKAYFIPSEAVDSGGGTAG